jgi:hypothetical protein
MLQQAGMNQMNNMLAFGQVPLNTGMQGLQQGLGFINSINRLPPNQFRPVQVQPGLS